VTQSYTFFAPASRGIAPLLAQELRDLGAESPEEHRAGVGFSGPLATGYRVCLWSRLASRLLLVLARVEAITADALYEGIRNLPWRDHMAPSGTLAVSFNGTSEAIRNSHFGALRVKDAIVDYFRDSCGERPSVDLEHPSLRINVHLYPGQAVVSLDLSGHPLHRRGYRVETVEAPLKENLAAAVLVRAGWPAVAAAGGGLVDLMCGSGTLLIEGAWMAADRAPALGRQDLGLLRWLGHESDVWKELVEEAGERRQQGFLSCLPPIRGFDIDLAAVNATQANLRKAGLGDQIPVHVERRPLDAGPTSADLARDRPTGLVVANPPYGHRLSGTSDARAVMAELGKQLRLRFSGWQAAVLTTSAEWAHPLGLRSGPEDHFSNGALECSLLRGRIPDDAAAAGPSPGAQMFANRLKKNQRILGKWARKAGITCFRLYDADLPEYALAVDVYGTGDGLCVHAQEYRAPASIDPARAAGRLQEALTTIEAVLEVPRGQLFFKVRERKKGTSQYEKLGAGNGKFHEVREGPCTLLVNFTDYLDTGLFLDHRLTREMIRELAPGKRFLNLFGYTGSATVHAAAGGAVATTTLDLSNTYLDWARRNLQRNGFGGPAHALEQVDCMGWLAASRRERYGLIFLDPPTFSNSKRMARDLDLQRDHARLISQSVRLLTRDGVLLFSTNYRHFELQNQDGLHGFDCVEISRATLPRDFARNPRIHRCWRISRSG
jgi:23S rRNA (guanine2445-N2)-methyltransferase / 23S rRNA (guanine2069-N7)-methyltransferase